MVGLGGVVWWSVVVGWECLACLPLFWGTLGPMPAWLPTPFRGFLPTSFLAYPCCLWAGYPSTYFAYLGATPWPTLAYPLATLCLFPGYLWPVSVLVPYLFSWLLPDYFLATLCLLPGLALGCPVLHLLYMGLRPVTCPVSGSYASGSSSTLSFGIYV